MNRTTPAETKLVICVEHRFALWVPPPEMPARIRARWPEMRVLQLPGYEGLDRELPDTDIFVGFSPEVGEGGSRTSGRSSAGEACA